MADQYSVEFNVEEVEKLKRIAQLLMASAGQNEEYNDLAAWLTAVVVETNGNDDGDDKPKKTKIKKKGK